MGFEDQYGWSVATHLYAEIQGSDGFYATAVEELYPGQSSTSLSFADNIAGSQTSSVSYIVSVFIRYWDLEWGQESWAGPSNGFGGVNYAAPAIPSGETTTSAGYTDPVPTIHRFMSTLHGGSFSGRTTSESSPGYGGPDTCWFPGSAWGYHTSVTGGSWPPVDANNQYGADRIGWLPEAVNYYRANLRAPCETTMYQNMSINCPGCSSDPYHYITNTIRTGMSEFSVWSERAGVYADRVWP